MIKQLLFMIAMALAAQTADAQRAVILIRHAERVDASTDSPLSTIGQERARRLVAQLKDAGITAIYTTQFQRTIQTAEPLARAIAVEPVIVHSTEQAKLIERIRTQHANDVVLIVGHSNSLPAIMKELGATQPVTIADDQYGDAFILVPGKPGPFLMHLHLVE